MLLGDPIPGSHTLHASMAPAVRPRRRRRRCCRCYAGPLAHTTARRPPASSSLLLDSCVCLCLVRFLSLLLTMLSHCHSAQIRAVSTVTVLTISSLRPSFSSLHRSSVHRHDGAVAGRRDGNVEGTLDNACGTVFRPVLTMIRWPAGARARPPLSCVRSPLLQRMLPSCLAYGLFRLETKIFWVSHRMCRKDVGRGF